MNNSAPTIFFVYHFHRVDVQHEKNLNFFLAHAQARNVSILVTHSSPIPDQILSNYPHIEFREVKNLGFDFAGYVHGWKRYLASNQPADYLFLANSGVVGPFIPSYASYKYWEPFLELFDSAVGAVGTSINIWPTEKGLAPHIQSMFVVIPKHVAFRLEQIGFLNQELIQDHKELVNKFEIGLSTCILNEGLNITSILPISRGVDFRTKDFGHHPVGDQYFRNSYKGRTINPYDVIFFKTSRNLLDPDDLDFLRTGIKEELVYPIWFRIKSKVKRIFLRITNK
jgi:hypothetical protein